MTIVELANKLGESLENSAEFTRMKKAELAQSQDKDACEVLNNFTKIRDDIAMRAQSQDISREAMMDLRNEMQRENDKLMQNGVIAEYVDAMQEFNSLMQTVNDIIGSYIAPEKHAGCGGECAGCQGCDE